MKRLLLVLLLSGCDLPKPDSTDCWNTDDYRESCADVGDIEICEDQRRWVCKDTYLRDEWRAAE